MGPDKEKTKELGSRDCSDNLGPRGGDGTETCQTTWNESKQSIARSRRKEQLRPPAHPTGCPAPPDLAPGHADPQLTSARGCQLQSLTDARATSGRRAHAEGWARLRVRAAGPRVAPGNHPALQGCEWGKT